MPKKKKPTLEQLTLAATRRDVVGKKVKQIRKQGLVPANVFGPNFTSVSISITAKDFLHAYKVVHETGIVYISLENDSIPTLIKLIQRHPLTRDILHVDFRKIDLKQKIETAVPIEITGASQAVNQLGGVLLKQHDHLQVEALPAEIPAHIAIDISKLTELGQEIKVKDIGTSTSYSIKNDPETVIVSVIAHKEESIEPETAAAAAPEVITEKPAEGEEAAPAAEGEPPTAEKEKAPEKKPDKKSEKS